MTRAMAHRGELRWQKEIQSVSMASQSYVAGGSASSGALHVIIDGEIHNRKDLQVEADVDAATVVLRCYQRGGISAIGQLIGDFAFVIYDEHERRLIAARDALGMRPLYFHRDAATLRLASESQALIAAGVDNRPDLLAIALFMTCDFKEQGHSLRDGIEALPPGHLLIANGSGIEMRRYWKPNPWHKLDVDEQEAATMFAETFREAVRCRMPRTGKLGVILSGGLDSSSIACQAAALDSAPTALHCSLSGWDCDETPIGRAVSEKWSMPWIAIAGNGGAMKEATRPHSRHPDQLYQTWSACFDALFARARREGIDTVMTGLGGDQMVDENGSECVDALRAGALREAATITGIDRAPFSLQSYRRLYQGIKGVVPARLRFATRQLRPRHRPPFLSPSWTKRVQQHVDADRRDSLDENWPDRSSAAMCAMLEQHGIRISAANCNLVGTLHGLEVTHPFLDRRVFELALAMPRRHRLRRGWRKRKPMLRRAMVDLLPGAVATRRDAAEFSCYLRDVYVRVHSGEVSALLADSRLADLGIINLNEVRSALDAGLPSPSHLIHFGMVLSMELWLRQDWS